LERAIAFWKTIRRIIMLHQPEFRLSYRGKSSYTVGRHIEGLGEPRIEVCNHLYHTDLCDINNPESFWTTELAQVGTVYWESSCVPFDGCRHEFPPASIIRKFSQYTAGRWSKDFKSFEVVDPPPILVATQTGFENRNKFEMAIASGHITRVPYLWQGIAHEMSKDLWFAKVFPSLYPSHKVDIVNNLDRCGVTLPSGLTVPDQPYVYPLGQHIWEIRLSQLRKPIQYFSKVDGWTEAASRATKFYREQDAEDSLGAALQARSPGALGVTRRDVE
jgi:hypothetical protein